MVLSQWPNLHQDFYSGRVGNQSLIARTNFKVLFIADLFHYPSYKRSLPPRSTNMRALGLCIAVDFLMVKSLNTWTATAGRPLFLSRSSYCHRGWGHFLEPILGSHSDIRGNFGIKKCTKHPLFSQNTQCKSPTQNFVFEIKNIPGRSAVAIFHLKIFVVPDNVQIFQVFIHIWSSYSLTLWFLQII